MNYEKSCGAIIYRFNTDIEYLIIFNKKGNAPGHWGFPKGHVEANETELQTATREIFEETGLIPDINTNFKVISRYSPHPGTYKNAVYFLAKTNNNKISIQKSELADYRWCNFENACSLLTYDENLLKKADKYLKENHSHSVI